MSKLYKLVMAMALGLSFIPSEESQAKRERKIRKNRRNRRSMRDANSNSIKGLGEEKSFSKTTEMNTTITDKNILTAVTKNRDDIAVLEKKLASFAEVLDSLYQDIRESNRQHFKNQTDLNTGTFEKAKQ